MGTGHYARKKQHKGDKPLSTKYRTRRKTKDLDQIHDDMKPEVSKKLLKQDVDLDLPGSGQFYCLHCSKHFIGDKALKDHFKSKPHKRRMKALSVEPYTQAEADRAAGMGSYVAPKKIKLDTSATATDTSKMDETDDVEVK
ncbi:unnamed protein product [Owenia fusiformis]|uniref:Uncharacterized protein n=1 Tax=Owenia fusiformis TaxID=6347 RepID=A0A8J1XJZ3_OWEFU|nr:unnamed protein product [Owenia fusiformis]